MNFTANGSNGYTPGPGCCTYIPLITSSEPIPPHTRLQVLSAEINGDFSSCTYSNVGIANADGDYNIGIAGSIRKAATPSRLANPSSYTTGNEPEKIAIVASCNFYEPGIDEHRPVPSFDASFTFGTTDVSALTGAPFS